MQKRWNKKKNTKNTKIILSVVTIVALIIGTFVGVKLYKDSKDTPALGPEVTVTPTPASSQGQQGQTNNSSNFTVTFANTSDTTEDQAKVTKLPSTASVAPGTLISTLEQPERYGSMFVGWYYDADKMFSVGDLDQVNENLTLYPRFATREGFADEFSPNFVSRRNQKGDFAVEIAAFGLDEEQILKRLRGWNMSEGKAPVGIQLVPVQSKVTYDENAMYLVDENGNIIGQMENTDGGDGFIPEDPMQQLDEETKKELASIGIDIDTATEAELKEFYGLSKDESLIRYLREKMDLDIETAILLQATLEQNAALKNGKHYYIVAVGGEWTAGELYQMELTDTARVRFVYDDALTGSKVTLYNFSIERQEINTLVIRDGVTYIPAKETTGVEVGGGLFNVISNSDKNAMDKNVSAGTMTFAGTLTKGTVVAVYDGTLKDDGTVDGQVSYLEITGVLGNNQYSYTGAEFENVVFIPDVLPIKDDGSYSDGKVTVAKSALSFGGAEYKKFNLDKDTTVDKGDYITFYTGNLNSEKNITLVGYGKVTGVTENGASYEISYETVDVNEVLSSFQMYSSVDDVEIPVTEEVASNLKNEMLANIADSNLAEESALYIAGLIAGDFSDLSEFEHAEELKNMTFTTDDGKELTLEEVRLLADGGAKKVKVSDPTLKLTLDHKLKHFKGEGIRGEVSVSFKVEIELNSVGATTNKIEIGVTVALQQEIVLGLDVSIDAEWSWYACIPILDEVNVNADVRAGTYSGFGVVATIQTKSDNSNEDSEWEDLIKATGDGQLKEVVGLEKMGKKLEDLSKTLKKVQQGGGYSTNDSETKLGAGMSGSGVKIGGDLPTKYSGMLSNDAEYVNLVKQELFRLPISPDPLHLVEFSLEADLVVSFKLNCMIGAGISYGNAKQYSFNAKVFAKESSSSEADLETPNFRVDFYVFGMVGARIGILLDARVGIISTKIDSIGITAEAGFYAELYGFLYVFYAWESGSEPTSGAMGSMLFEIGMYLDVNFVAQLGDGKLSAGKEIYSNTWPLLQLGAVDVPMEFEIKQNDSKLTVEIPEHKNTVAVPQELFKMKMMGLKDGKLTSVSKDSDKTGDASYTFTVNGRTFTQYNEEHFEVTCYDTDKDGNIISGNSFQYLPATNEIYVKPASTDTNELWGVVEFVYKNETFGFNTVKLKRKVKVHWKGVPASARVEYYMEQEDGSYKFVEEGQFDGFDGIEYDLLVDEEMVYKYDGYRLTRADFTDEERMNARIEELRTLLNAAYKDYDKYGGKARREKYEQLSKQFRTAFDHRTNYWNNIGEVLRNRKGTLYFLMVSNETVVKLYYTPYSSRVYYYVDPQYTEVVANGIKYSGLIYEPSKYGENTLPINSSLFENMPGNVKKTIAEDTLYDYTYYMYTYHYVIGNKSNLNTPWREMIENKDKWVKISKDAKLPDEMGCLFYVIAMPETPKQYKVTFKVDNQVVAEEQVAYDTTIQLPQQPTKRGYEFAGWKNDKTEEIIKSDAKMAGENMNFSAVWEPKTYKITCNANDQTWTIDAKYGESLLNTINSDANTKKYASYREDYGIEWHVRNAENDSVIELVHTVPDTELTVYGEYVLNPEHQHIWNVEKVNREATCSKEGENAIYCSVCGEKSTEVVPMNDNHVNLEERGGVEVTCLVDGKEPDLVCADCGFVKSYGSVIRARGWHIFRQGIVKEFSTCTTHGYMLWTCDVCGEEKEEEDPLNPRRHSGPFVVGEDSKKATCGEDGFTGTTYCSGCGQVYKVGVVIPATGMHRYTDFEYKWAEDYSSCTGTAVCSVCGDKAEEKDETTLIYSRKAGCDYDGAETYWAPFGGTFSTQEIDKVLPALGHDYTITYEWSNENAGCYATATCAHDKSHDIQESALVTQDAVRYEDGTGKVVYTATFKNSVFETQTKQETLAACTHEKLGTVGYTWSDTHDSVTAKVSCKDCNTMISETAKSTKEVKKAATCEAAGELVYSASFKNSAFAAQTYTEAIAKLDHKYGTATYTWTEDKSECSAEMTCANDASHKITETVTTTNVDSTENGKLTVTFTAQFANAAFTTQTKAVTYDEAENAPTVTYAWKEDHSQVTAIAVYPISGAPLVETVAVTSSDTPATCEEDGVRVYTATFVNAVFEDQTERETLPKTGHSYGTATYTWAEDCSTCTAELVCENDASHKISETVSATIDAEVDKGKGVKEITYKTAAYANQAFAVQTKTIEKNTCEHVYPAYEDSGNITLKESAGGSYVSTDGSTHYTIAKSAWQLHTCTKCGYEMIEEIGGFIDYPPKITAASLKADGYLTLGDVINASPSTFGEYFVSIGEFKTENGDTVEVIVPGTHVVTDFLYFDNANAEFVTREQFIEMHGGEEAPLTSHMGLCLVVTFYPSDGSYFTTPLEAQMEIY